jgi:glycerol-3-phosphate dehydrogenase (NAD(P)+)
MVNQPSFLMLGAGSWGTALATLIAHKGYRTQLWGRNRRAMAEMAVNRQNGRYLEGIKFPDDLQVISDLTEGLRNAHMVVIVVPSTGFREVLKKMAGIVGGASPPIIWATKGIETDSAKLLHRVIEEELGDHMDKAVLSGPSFAREVALGLPTAVTVAASDLAFASYAAEFFHSHSFRTYSSNDVIGVELGGALKNVLAIAAGISDGLGFGANARAALITRGLSEIMRLGECFGARRETLMGLSGVGDLVLTCTDNQSRNRRLGLAIGQGKSLQAAHIEIGQAIEGAATAKVVEQLAEEHRVEMPIAQEVYRVLYEDHNPHQAVSELLARHPKVES